MALFQARALLLAARLGDGFALQSVTRPTDVAALLGVARGRRRVVELGTAVGWTTASLALADPGRRVLSFDPVVQPHRDRYLALLPASARARVELVAAPGAAGAAHDGGPADLLFVDSTHTHEGTVEEVRAWAPRLAPGAAIVLHDYDNPAFPGVRRAVEDLGLSGHALGGSFIGHLG